MKKGFIILIIFILVCIAGGSFLAIHLIRNIEVNETSIVKEPLNHEGIENFTSVNLDLTSMDVKIEKSSENAISYRLQDAKKQKLDYSVDNEVLNVKEMISDKHFVGHDDNEVIIYTTNDSLVVNGNLVAGDVELKDVAMKNSRITTVSGDISIQNGNLSNCTLISTSGDIELDGHQIISGDNTLNSTSGDISVENINDVSINASTTSGDIEIGEDELTGSVNRVLGTNNATLTLNSTSGDIEVN